MEEKKPQKLTKKQRNFVDAYVESENGIQSVLKSYNVEKPEVAGVIASQNLKKLNVIEAIEEKKRTLRESLEAQGITSDYLAKKVNVLLKAKDPQGNKDFVSIDKGLKHALSIHGINSDDDKPKTQNVYNFLFTGEGKEKIKHLEAEIKNVLIKPPKKDNE